jgi:multiple sugar transport system substrate-binding protein
LIAVSLGLLFLTGCPNPEADKNTKPAAKPLEGVKLRIAVADDPALAAAIRRVTGEWTAQTGAELQVETLTAQDLAKTATIATDAAICPSYLLGDLAERKLLAPVPPQILQNPEWAGILELPKLREVAWGKEIMAVPFGSPVLCCYYRADLLEKLHRRPPKTWAQYQDLAKLLAQENPQGKDKSSAWAATIEPLASGWAGLTFLARAASLAKNRDNYSTLFNMETMEPLIAGPPFVQAMEDLVAAAKLGPKDPLRHTPTTAREAFWNGQCGMALTWPTGTGDNKEDKKTAKDSQKTKEGIRVGFVELPGSKRVFNTGSGVWDTRTDEESLYVPLLAIAGRIGVVGAKSSNTDAAFQLLLWLSDSTMSPQISAKSPDTTLFRKSNLQSPGPWVEKQVPALTAVRYADVTEATMRHEQWLGALRMPGRAEYLAALDEAVAQTVRGEKSAMNALLQAEKKWRTVTERLGVDRQKAAYRHSLGLE